MDSWELEEYCQRNIELSRRVVDDFLLPLVTKQDKLSSKFTSLKNRYSAQSRFFNAEQDEMFRKFYIASRVFTENGLIGSYMNHRLVKKRDEEEIEYLKRQAETPWRVTVFRVDSRIDRNIFTIRDLFKKESLTLHSSSLEGYAEEIRESRYFISLLEFNGECWQIYGVMNPLPDLSEYDLITYATAIDNSTASLEDVSRVMNRNPYEFLLLLAYFNHESERYGETAMRYNTVQVELESFPHEPFKESAYCDEKDGVYEYLPEEWFGFPHFTVIYYDSNSSLLQIESDTDESLFALKQLFSGMGIELPRLHYSFSPLIVEIINEVFRRDISISYYRRLFMPDRSKSSCAKQLKRCLKHADVLTKDGVDFTADELAQRYGLSTHIVEEAMEK